MPKGKKAPKTPKEEYYTTGGKISCKKARKQKREQRHAMRRRAA
ncbi:MAG: hypothetical protein WCW56_01430 [Candidatus Paceibacterota bacterium]|jgi:hypothetical protein